jgi:hypothetical protein
LKRKCEKVSQNKDGNRAIYVDLINKKQIINYILQDDRHKEKFRFIRDIILAGLHNNKLYKKENISSKCKDVYAMRLFVGQENDRIYCKQVQDNEGTHVIVMAILHEKKKSNELSSKEISQIEKIGGYTYEFEK